MILGVLELLFICSIIPAFRELFKRAIRSIYITFGVLLLLTELVGLFFVYPKLITLYKEVGLTLNYQMYPVYYGIGLIASLVILLLGVKFKGFTISNLRFYSMFLLLIVLTHIILQLTIVELIQPIFSISKLIE